MIFTKNKTFSKKRPGWQRRKFVYSRKTYVNPFFRQRRNSISGTGLAFSKKIKLAIFAAVITGLIIIWLLFFSNLFKINKIDVSGVGEAQAQEVQSLAWSLTQNRLLGKNNLLLYNKSELYKILHEKYFLQNLSIQKKLFHTLKINLQNRQQTAAWHEADKYFFLDSEGNIINQVDHLNINRLNYPVIENLTDINITDNKANIDKPTIDYIINLFNEFKDNQRGFEIEKFIVDKDVNTVKMFILDGPKIYFNTGEPVARQTTELDLIIKEKLKDSFKSKEYIDLRYGNNVYIK